MQENEDDLTAIDLCRLIVALRWRLLDRISTLNQTKVATDEEVDLAKLAWLQARLDLRDRLDKVVSAKRGEITGE